MEPARAANWHGAVQAQAGGAMVAGGGDLIAVRWQAPGLMHDEIWLARGLCLPLPDGER
jgi:hypothetical protein